MKFLRFIFPLLVLTGLNGTAATVFWPGNYGPGDLVVFTNTQSTVFVVTNSGTAGNPITFSNLNFSAATWGSTQDGNPDNNAKVFDFSGRNFIIVTAAPCRPRRTGLAWRTRTTSRSSVQILSGRILK